MQNSRIGWRKRLAASIACALVAALSFSGMEMTASADEQTDGSQAQGVHAVNNADVPVIEPDSPEAKLYSLPDEAADDDSEDATADDAEEDYDPEDFFADAAPLAVNGQDRSAGDVVGPSNHSREDGLWTLSVAGEVTHVTYKNGRYVPDASRDIPFWKRSCTPNYGISGGFSGEGFTDNRGVFDGLAVSSAKKDATTMYAVHSYSNTTTSYKVEEANSGVALYRYREGHGWNTWRITGYEGNWKITEQRVQWNGSCAQGSSSISASYNPSTSTPNSSKNSERNYTFDSARTNFSGGAIINAGTPQEAYIFGGTDSTQFQGSGGKHYLKIFSFQPGNGGGVVKYLGFIKLDAYNGPQSVYSGFTTDAEGNVYVAVGQKFSYLGGDPVNLSLKVYKLTNIPAEMADMANAETGRQFTFGEDGHWGGSYSFDNAGCGVTGGTSTNTGHNCTGSFQSGYAKKVVDTTLEFSESVDGFTGISIAPGKHVTVGVTLGNRHHGKVVEIKENQTLADEGQDHIKFFDAASLTYADVHKNNNGILNILHTDIEGVLHGLEEVPPTPENPRTLTLIKSVKNRKDGDQFQVDLNPTKGHNNQTIYAINRNGNKTDFSDSDGEKTIGSVELPSGLFQARIGERGFSRNGTLLDMRKSYTTTLVCEGAAVGDAQYDATNGNRFFDITVDPTTTTDVSCTLINVGPQSDTPTAKVTVYKHFVSFFNNNDTFYVGFNDGEDHASETASYYNTGFDYGMGSANKVPVGKKIKVFEKDRSGSVADYRVSIACYKGTKDNHDRNPFAQGTSSSAEAGMRQLNDVTIPQDASEVSCFVTNEAKSKNKTVTVQKIFDNRYNDNDNFTVTASDNASQTQASVTTYGSGNSGKKAFSSNPVEFSHDTTITVHETGLNQDLQMLRNYDIAISCSSNGSELTALSTPGQGRNAKTFNLSEATGTTVNCVVNNKSHIKPKTVYIHKKFDKRYNSEDNFTLTVKNTSNESEVLTGSTTGTNLENAGSYNDLGSAEFSNTALIQIVETAANSSTNIKHYTTSMKCTEGAVGAQAITSYGNGYFDLSSTNASDVHCYVDNVAKEKPTKKIHLHKKFTGFVKNTDAFRLGLRFGSSSIDKRPSAANMTPNQDRDLMQLDVPVEDNANSDVTVFEEPVGNTEKNKYDVSLKCYNGEESSRQVIDIDQNGSPWTLRVNSNNAKDIHCYVTNSPKTPQRMVTLMKKFVNAKNTSGFTISGQVTDNYQGNTFNTANTDHHSDGQPFQIGESKAIPDGAVKIALQETGNFNKFVASAKCVDAEGKELLIDGTLLGGNNRWEATNYIPENFTGAITCTITNAVPTTKVVLYKQFKPYDTDDQFTVGMTDTPADSYVINGKNTVSVASGKQSDIGDGYIQYEIGEIAERPAAGQARVQVWETPGNSTTNLTNYTSSLTCRTVGDDGTEGAVKPYSVENRKPSVQSTDVRRQFDFIVDGTQKGRMNCYLRNEPKPKPILGSITITKLSSVGNMPIAGSQWKVEKSVGNGSWTLLGYVGDDNQNVDNVPSGQHIDDADMQNAGVIKLDNLPIDDGNGNQIKYKISESAAPAGFLISTEARAGYEFTLTTDNLQQGRPVLNDPTESPDLPFTGGLGTIPYMLGGLSVLLGAIAVTTLTGGKRRKQN